MKIACLIGSLQMGGAERQMVVLASTLSRMGHEVTVLTYHPLNFYRSELEKSGAEYLCFSGGTSLLRSAFFLAHYMKSTGTGMMISFLRRPCVKACLAHILYPRFKLVVSERGAIVNLRRRDKLRFRMYRKADAVISNSFAQREVMVSQFPKLSGLVVTVPNAVDTALFHPGGGRRSSPRIVLVTARICAQKNFLGLIEAAKLMKSDNFQIRWYGSASGKYASACLKTLEESGLGDSFLYFSSVLSVEEIYREATVFCLPSFNEGTSNSLAEALASGLPVAASRVSDNAMYVGPDNGVLIEDPSDPRCIAEALDSLLALPDDALEAMGERSRRIAVEKFSFERYEGQYAALLDSIMGR